MIQANELRIDNWYLLENPMSSEPPKPYRFETWTTATDFIAYGQPIPLTPEILEKSSFKQSHRKDGEWYRLGLDIWEVDGGRSGFVMRYGSAFHRAELRYVHQLQNLYFVLTGTELYISL
jgi:hypothetical protein